MRHKGLAILLTSLAPLLGGSITATAQLNTFRSTMSLVYPTPLILKPPSGVHKSTLIFLHGLGDTGACREDICLCHFFAEFTPALTQYARRPSLKLCSVCRGRLGRCGRI